MERLYALTQAICEREKTFVCASARAGHS